MHEHAQSRVIRHQFRRGGLVHLAVVTEFFRADGSSYHVTFPPTMCGKSFPVGSGGWGHGLKRCRECWSVAAPAERIDDRHALAG